MTSFWSVLGATLVKDIRLEWRSKDALNSMLFFSLLVVVIFVFSFDPLAERAAKPGARCLSRCASSGQRVVPCQVGG